MTEVALNPTYRVTCPYCNGQLYPIAFTPESAPWACSICHYAWWASELTEEARKIFRPFYADFGFGPKTVELQEKVQAEREEARVRGTSVRMDQLQLLPANILRRLPESETDFGDFLKLEITRKGG